MMKLQRLVPMLALCASITLAACATAANTTDAVGDDTGSAVGSVGNGVVAVVEWPFHVIADIL
jgi:predicted small secreted protein